MLLAGIHSTTPAGTGKGLRARRAALGALVLLLVPVPGLPAGELIPGPRDSVAAGRWETVVPLPADRETADGVWAVGPEVRVSWGPVTPAERDLLADRLDRTFRPLGRTWRPAAPSEAADLVFAGEGGTGEGYTLTLGPSGCRIGASGPVGRFYGLVSLVQLLPPSSRTRERIEVPSGRITDAPVLAWRGLMVDSSRHFLDVATLQDILELMALHKLNRFHWHLTDDQGWRLEVPGWPRLTEVGAWRTEADGRRYGGFYTAADIRRVVAFASARHITVVPEVDLPGHSSAALASYPELSATGAPRAVPLEWGVADGVLSIGRRSVTRFTADVLSALVALFPGPWIHWGGDEVFRTPWTKNAESLAWMRSVKAPTPEQALGEFWNDLARRTLQAGKIPVGWDEAALHGPPRETVIQWWDDPARALVALKAGHPLIASWKEASYLDYPEWGWDSDRAWWMPLLPLETVGAQPFLPPGAPASARNQLLGVEATLFTERVEDPRVERKLFPRLALVAELAWRGEAVPGWAGRIGDHRTRLAGWGVGMPPMAR